MDLRHFNDEDPIFLAQVQRGITNFVKILTGKDIPVEYATSGDSIAHIFYFTGLFVSRVHAPQIARACETLSESAGQI